MPDSYSSTSTQSELASSAAAHGFNTLNFIVFQYSVYKSVLLYTDVSTYHNLYISVFCRCIHRIHNGAQNHQIEAGQASSFKFCKFASFKADPGMPFSVRTTDVEFEVAFAILQFCIRALNDCPGGLN